MTALTDLQEHLAATGRYAGAVDGLYGPATLAAILLAMRDGPDTALALQDYRNSGARLGVPAANVAAFAQVEASGAGFEDGQPKILFEPHRFSRLTGHKFDRSHSTISYPRWGMVPYPKTQAARYAQLLHAVALDVDAGFAAASYGKFQILGENYAACGYASSWEFAFAQAFDECTQLKAFEGFIRVNGITPYLRTSQWAEVAKRYNGTAFAKNKYDVKLARAAHDWQGKLAA
jgi:hypothetical protein